MSGSFFREFSNEKGGRGDRLHEEVEWSAAMQELSRLPASKWTGRLPQALEQSGPRVRGVELPAPAGLTSGRRKRRLARPGN